MRSGAGFGGFKAGYMDYQGPGADAYLPGCIFPENMYVHIERERMGCRSKNSGFRGCCSYNIGIPFISLNSDALKGWNDAYSIYSMGAYDASVKEYEEALMQFNGDFMTNYGKALSMAGQHKEAVARLQEAAAIYPNTVVYTALGDSFKATGQNSQAEAAYLHAWHMNPSRFYPKYLLAKFYKGIISKKI